MFGTINVMFALKYGLIVGLIETTYPLAYSVLRGRNIKKRFGLSSNRSFRVLASGVKALAIFVPMQYGFSGLLIFPMIFFLFLGLQIISDDYIHSF